MIAVISWCTLDVYCHFLVHSRWLLLFPSRTWLAAVNDLLLSFLFHVTFVDHRDTSDFKPYSPACCPTWNGEARKTEATSFRCETFSQWRVQSCAWAQIRNCSTAMTGHHATSLVSAKVDTTNKILVATHSPRAPSPPKCRAPIALHNINSTGANPKHVDNPLVHRDICSEERVFVCNHNGTSMAISQKFIGQVFCLDRTTSMVYVQESDANPKNWL